MQLNNKIYSFFILLALLYWNPISYFFIFNNTAVFSKELNYLFYLVHLIIFFIGILLIFLIQKNKLTERIKNIILSIAVIGIMFSILVIIDTFAGFIIKNEESNFYKPKRLIFEPNSHARYRTTEFDYEVSINSLGLRDKEIQIEKMDKYRILCFGDSWTFGWGVNIENSWPKVLEQYLLKNEIKNIEVINCGAPGQYTSIYKKYIQKIVPILKPDLVLVGVLQLDDLAQIYQNRYIIEHDYSDILKKYAIKVKSIIIRYIKYSFKNILFTPKTFEVKSNWKKTSKSMMEGFNHLQKIRFYTLNDSVRSLFRSGDLNPGLVNYYINFSDRTTIFNNPNHPATKFSIQEMNKDVAEMRDNCYKYDTKLIFINLPNNYFTGHNVIRTPSDILNSYYETHNKIDPIYRSVANTNNLPYIEITKHFIGLQNKSDYYFRYDGHPTEKGYEEIANYIGEQLIKNNHLIKK